MKKSDVTDAIERGWIDIRCEGELCNPEDEARPEQVDYSSNWCKASVRISERFADGLKYVILLPKGWSYYPGENWKQRCPRCSEYFDKNQE